MRITLTRQILLKVAEVFLFVQRNVLRKDIHDYLNGNGYDDNMVNDRIKNYLKAVGIYDDDFVPTKDGILVKETGMFKSNEMGKYKIWLDGNRIVFIQRIEPDRSYQKTATRLELALHGKKHFCLPTNEEGFYRFEVLSKEIYGTFTNGSDTIIETIEVKEDGAITEFDGQLIKDIQNKSVKENVEFPNVSLFDMAQIIFQDDWNEKTEKLKVSLCLLDGNANAIETFRLNHSYDWKQFTVQVGNWPIEPYDRSEAIEWRNRLLNKEIAKNYLTEGDFNGLVLDINEKDGFSAYASDLDKPQIEEYLKKETKIHSGEYWNLRAPLDLNPNIPKERVVEHFILAQGEERSLKSIQERIETRQVDAVFYYDKYVINGKQQRIAGIFVDAFNSGKKHIITDLSNKERKSRYIATQKKNIREVDTKSIFGNASPQHDRYLIFVVGKETVVWSITNSTGYINFPESEFSAETVGKMNTGVTFTKLEDIRVLNEELRNYINKEMKNA